MLWIQAPLPQVVEGVVVAAEQESIAAPVAAVVADRNDVRCLNDLWWGIAKAATPFPVATDDRCPKRCLTAFLGVAVLSLYLTHLKAGPFIALGQLDEDRSPIK